MFTSKMANPTLSQSMKRKASSDSIQQEALSKASRITKSTSVRDTIVIDGEVYDRRKRPGSIDGLNAQPSPYIPDLPLQSNLMAFRSSVASPSVVSTSFESPRLTRRNAMDDLRSQVSLATALDPLNSSMLTALTSPTNGLSLSPSLQSRRPSPKSRHSAPLYPQSPFSSPISSWTGFGLDFLSETQSEISELPSSPSQKTGKTRVRKKQPPKGTPQPKMGADETGSPIHVARPPNAWILYRSDQLQQIKKDPVISKKPQADISKLIGALWREEKPEVKQWYEEQALIAKEAHLKAHPGASLPSFMHLGLSNLLQTTASRLRKRCPRNEPPNRSSLLLLALAHPPSKSSLHLAARADYQSQKEPRPKRLLRCL